MKVKAILMPVRSEHDLLIVKYIRIPNNPELVGKYYSKPEPVTSRGQATLLARETVENIFEGYTIEWTKR